MRIDRMLAIVVILLNRRRITAKALAERFEVSLRTIYRDIEAINTAGIPVISNQGSGGGYEIPDNYKFSRQYMSVSDMRSVLTALKGVNAALNDQEMDLILEKVQSLLPEKERKESDEHGDYVIFDPSGWRKNDISGKRIQQIYDAIKQCCQIELEYTDRYGRISVRIIEPMTLIQKGFSWYVSGLCLKRQEKRLFKLTRIREIRVSDTRFERKTGDFSGVEHQWDEKGKLVDVVLQFSANLRHVVSDYFENAQIISEDEKNIIIKEKLPDQDWLIGMILSFGPLVEVLSPLSFRRKIQIRIDEMASVYKE